MSRKGGYKIIDLKGYDFSNADMVIEGIYDTIENNYGKPLLFTGIVIDGIEKDDVYVMATTIGTSYQINLYDKVVTISDLDVVSSKIKFKREISERNATIEEDGYYYAGGTSTITIKGSYLPVFGSFKPNPTGELYISNVLLGTSADDEIILELVDNSCVILLRNGIAYITGITN